MYYCDLFSGCGGVSVGFEEAGFTCVVAVDNDKNAAAIYKENFPTHPFILHDLSLPLSLPEGDEMRELFPDCVMCGGAPCQDFSLCGPVEKKKLGQRARLTPAFARHVLDWMPRWVVFENVRNAQLKPQFAELMQTLQAAGYVTRHEVLLASEFGMAQKRFRLILLATRGEDAGVRLDCAWRHIHAQKVEGVLTVREQLARYQLTCPHDFFYYPAPRLRTRSIYSVDEPSPTIRGRTRPLPSTYEFQETDSTKDSEKIFNLDTRHIAALQHFPAWFRWLPNRGVVNNQCIGNAVPPVLARIIGNAIMTSQGKGKGPMGEAVRNTVRKKQSDVSTAPS